MNKQTKIILFVVILLVVAAAILYPRLDVRKSNESSVASESAGPDQPSALPVKVVKLQKETLRNQLSVTGTIIPNESVNIRTEVSGLI